MTRALSPALYTPLYFLAALGSGGITISFFMWLMFWVPHPAHPVPVFEDIYAAFTAGDPMLSIAITIAAIGILVFAYLKFKLLIWNLSTYARWQKTAAYDTLRNSNNEVQLLAAPLAVAMAINVGFVLGLVFVPGLWSIVEFLFPAAMVAFLAVGIWALSLMRDYWGRLMSKGGFDFAKNNSFTQLIPAFALSMVGVGLAAPASMSATLWISGLAYILSSFFIILALMLAAVKLILGLREVMEHGTTAESAPSLWIVIPLLTVASIAFVRQEHGLHAHFQSHGGALETFTLLTTMVSLQVAFGLFGWLALKRQNYFGRFVFGEETSAGAYALVCPGVALVVISHFFINKGMVGVGMFDKFSLAYWVLTGGALVLQFATIALVLRLNAKHFGRRKMSATAHPAE